jgi:hypothetical protein
MGYNVKPPKSNFEKLAEGSYGCRLYGIGDLGDQEITYQGDTKVQRKILLTFELDAHMADGRVFSLSKDYTFTFYDQGKLLPVIEALLQRKLSDAEFDEFDITSLIGKEGMMEVKHSEKGFPNINTITRLARGVALPPKTNQPWFWWLTEDGFDAKAFERAPKWAQEKTTKSPQYKALFSQGPKPVQPLTPPFSASGSNSDSGAIPAVKVKGRGKAKAAEPGPRTQAWSEELNDSLPPSWGD